MNIGRDIPENILIAGLQSASNPYKLINFLNLRLWQDPCKQIVGVALLPMLCNATFPNCRADTWIKFGIAQEYLAKT